MSRKRQNNHYHYAEKYADREARRAGRRAYFSLAPVVFALLVLFAFGCISTTFSVFVASPDSSITTGNGLRVAIRTKQVDNPIADTSAVADDEVNSPVPVDENGDPIEIEAVAETAPVNVYTRKTDDELADTGVDVDLAETGASQRYIYCGISNWYDNNKDSSNWGFNFWGGTSGGVKSGTWIENITHDNRTYHMFRVQVYDDNNKAQFKRNSNDWIPGDGFSVTLNGTTNNAVFWSSSSDGWYGNFQENYQMTSTASLAASSTNITTAQTATLTPSLSSNATYNDIKSTTYSVTTNPNSKGSVTSAGVFSASAAGTYTVTATVTYNAKGFTGITKTASATKTITVTQASNPAASSVSLSASPTSNIFSGLTAVTYTASASGAVSGATYNFKIDGTSVQNSSATTYTTTYSSAGTYPVTVTVEKSGYSNVSSSTVSTTVLAMPSPYIDIYLHDTSTNIGGIMEYDAGASASGPSGAMIFKFRRQLSASENYYYNVWDGAKHYHANSIITSNTPVTSSGGVAGSESSDTVQMTTGTTGWYYSFYYDYLSHKFYIAYPITMTFDKNGHGTAPDAQKLDYNSPASEPAALTATGYTFGGWYTSKTTQDSTTAWNFSTNVTEDKTLYAKWTAKTTTVTLNQQSGSGGSSSVTATYGSSMPSATMPTRTGYTFGGYYTGTDGTGTQYYTASGASARNWDFESATKTLYAKWTATKYTITLHPDSGTIGSSWTLSSGNYTKNYYITSSAITLPTGSTSPAITKTGYTFIGWYDNDGLTGSPVTQVANGSYGNKEYWAKWSKEAYTITLHHFVSPITANASGTVLTDAWKTGKTVTSATADTTVLSYYVDTATITLPAESSFTNLAQSSGTPCGFVGWYDNSSFTGSAVTSVPLGSNGNKEYWARWTPKKVVRFYNNVTGDQIGSTQYITDGGNASAPSAPSMTGFTFSQWYCSSPASTGSATYTGITENRDIYAEYSIASPEFTLSLTGTFLTDAACGYTQDGTEDYPWMAEFGTTLTGNGSITSTYASGSTAINYKWKGTGNAAYSAYSTSTTFTSAALDTTKTILQDDAIEYELRAMAGYTGANGRTFESAAGSVIVHVKFYGVNSPIRSFTIEPSQRIYNAGEAIDTTVNPIVLPAQMPEMTAKISVNTPADYKAVVKQFNVSDDLEYASISELLATRTGGSPNFTVDSGDSTQMLKDYSGTLFEYLNTTGVKYFNFSIEREEDGVFVTDSVSETVSAAFGTRESNASRPLYFTSTTAVNGRLMLFYVDDTVKYQTGQRIGSTNKYRFMLPASVTTVYFAIADTDKEYVIPADPSDLSDEITGGYYTAKSGAVTIDETTMAFVCSSINTTTHEISGSVGNL